MGRVLLVQIAALFVALAASAQSYNTGGGYTTGGFGGTGAYDPNNPQGTVTTPLSLNYIYQFVDSLIVIRRAEMKKCVDTLTLNGQSVALKAVSDALELPPDENEWIRFTDFYMRASLKVLIYLRAPFHTMASKVYSACYLPPVKDVEEVDALIRAYLTPSALGQSTVPGFPSTTTTGSTFGVPSTTTNTTQTTNTTPDASGYYQSVPTDSSPGSSSSVTPAPTDKTSTDDPSKSSAQQSSSQKADPKKSSDSTNGLYIPNYE